MPEVSIVMSLKDRISTKMRAMQDSGRALSKDFDALLDRVSNTEDQQADLAKAIAKTKTSISQQTDTVRTARKALEDMRRSGNAAQEEIDRSAEAYQAAEEKLAALKDQLNDYSAASVNARAEIREMSAEWRKLRQEAENPGGTGGGSAPDDGIWGKLGNAGLKKMLGDSASQFAGAVLESAAGQPAASAISSIISGAATGLALGGPVGAAVGAGAGLISGAAKVFSARDDAFKDYYQQQYGTVTEEQAAMLSSGSATAGGREQTRMAFSRRLGGDEAADDFLGRVRAMAAHTNYGYDEITGYSKLLLNSYDADAVFEVLQSLSDATAGLDLSSSDVSMMISGLSRMRTTGKATQEYLNYFRERGVDTDQALMDMLQQQGVAADKGQIAEMVSKGQIGGVEAAEAILNFINAEFGGLSGDLAGTYDAMVDNLADAQANLEAEMGAGYNEERKKGVQDQMDWLEGNDALAEAYASIGAWQAELENSKERFIRDAVDAMMASDAYQEAQEEGNAAEMGRLIMEAKVQGMNEYNASEGAQLALQAELDLADAIREDSASDQAYWDAGYKKSQEFSRGLAAGLAGEIGGVAAPGNGELAPSYLMTSGREALYARAAGRGYATGLERVPYDGFPAVLHRDERVLTAGEARGQRAGTGGIVIEINGLSVREEADVERIASQLWERISLARMGG